MRKIFLYLLFSFIALTSCTNNYHDFESDSASGRHLLAIDENGFALQPDNIENKLSTDGSLQQIINVPSSVMMEQPF